MSNHMRWRKNRGWNSKEKVRELNEELKSVQAENVDGSLWQGEEKNLLDFLVIFFRVRVLGTLIIFSGQCQFLSRHR